MKIIEKQLKLDIKNAPANALFLDIETTGLSKERSHMYLFGCIYAGSEPGIWHFKQWLLESPLEERAVLTDLIQFIPHFDVLVHYNGDGFDLPYLDFHAKELGFESPFLTTTSFDIFKKIRLLKKLFKLESASQKSFEKAIGINRLDKYDGGKLIKIYYEYCKSFDPELLELLLLHNEEDVINMTKLLSLMPYLKFYDKSAELICEAPEVISRKADEALLAFTLNEAFPYQASFFIDDIYASLSGSKLNLRLPLFNGSLKYFFSHYQDYYYLPKEDMAVHKSVASAVDPAFRQKATRETCYIKKEGSFFPLLCTDRAHDIFKENACGCPFSLLTDAVLNDAPFWNDYIHELFHRLKNL